MNIIDMIRNQTDTISNESRQTSRHVEDIASEVEKRNNSTSIIIIILLLVAATIGGAYFILWQIKQNKTKATTR